MILIPVQLCQLDMPGKWLTTSPSCSGLMDALVIVRILMDQPRLSALVEAVGTGRGRRWCDGHLSVVLHNAADGSVPRDYLLACVCVVHPADIHKQGAA